MNFICSNCKNPYPKEGMPHLCSLCGNQFIPDSKFEISKEELFESNQSYPYWRFLNAFGLFHEAKTNYLGEGNTPVIEYLFNERVVHLKLESQNPTGSYKDRNSSVLMSQMKARGVVEFVEDSSGNAGASISAYAAKVKLKARIYAPSHASGSKKKQIEAFGADLNLIEGPRIATTDALLNEVSRGAIYASHALMPFGIPGIATIAFELVEQFGDTINSIIVPTGHGGLLFGIIWGFQLMLKNEIITKLPMFYGIQSEKCDPLTASKNNNYKKLGVVKQQESVAEGIMIINPSKSKQLLGFARQGLLDFYSVSDKDVLIAIEELNSQGINVENTSAVVIAALKQLNLSIKEPDIAIISGHGLKTI